MTSVLIPFEKFCFWLPKHGAACLIVDTYDSNAVYAEHQCLKLTADACHIDSRVEDTCLESWRMCNLEQRIDIVRVNLPQPEDLNVCGV